MVAALHDALRGHYVNHLPDTSRLVIILAPYQSQNIMHAGVITGLRMRTGFSPVEIFRKYMWYLLRERQFDQEAVDDMVHLKQVLGLTDDQVRCVLHLRDGCPGGGGGGGARLEHKTTNVL